MDDAVPAGVRMGELSRRVGVEPATLRAWERRYGLPRPGRSRAGQRLYDPAQELALRRMLALRAEGFAPQVAARLARGEAAGVRAARRPAPGAGPPALERGAGGAAAAAGSAAALEASLDVLDARAAHAALDHLLAARGLDLTLRDVVLPLLARIGDRWEAGDSRSARSTSPARCSADGSGARPVLRLRSRAAGGPGRPPGERHELGLLCFALLLHDRGWEVTFLGAGHAPGGPDRDGGPHRGRPRRPRRRDPGHARRGGAGAGWPRRGRSPSAAGPPRARSRRGRGRVCCRGTSSRPPTRSPALPAAV